MKGEKRMLVVEGLRFVFTACYALARAQYSHEKVTEEVSKMGSQLLSDETHR